MRKFVIVCFALFAAIALGQNIVNIPQSRPTHVSPDYSMPAGKIYINTATIPKPRVALSTSRFNIFGTGTYTAGALANYAPLKNNDGINNGEGAFRILCRWSHASFDDPIVWPGQPGKTHLHQFWGNENTASGSDLTNMASAGNSTCDGGIANRTGYWTPTMVYHCPAGTQSSCDRSRDGTVIIGDGGIGEFNGYYKTTDDDFPHLSGATVTRTTQAGSSTTAIVLNSAESGTVDNYMTNATLTIAGQTRTVTGYVASTRVATVSLAFTSAPSAGTSYTLQYRQMVWPPAGFRMIGGDASNATGNTASGVGTTDGAPRGFYECNNTTDSGQITGSDTHYTGSNDQFGHIPTTYETSGMDHCTDLRFVPAFPSCWDGVNLYLPGLQGASHVKNPHYGVGCLDPAFPQPIPTISYSIHFPTPNADLNFIRLSSDQPEIQGVTQAGSSTTTIVLAANENATANYYYMGTLSIGGVTRLVTAYNATTKVATVAPAFSGAPAAGVAYSVRSPAGASMHADWVGGWDQTNSVLGYDTITNMILNHCLRIAYDCHDSLLGNITGSPGSYNPQPSSAVDWWGISVF